MSCRHDRVDRRAFLGLLGVGLAAAVSGCGTLAGTPHPASSAAETPPSSGVPSPGDGDLDEPPSTQPGSRSTVLSAGPPASVAARQVALSVDDGYCDDCVAGYVAFAKRTGIHLTFSPNGLYGHAWAPHASVLRPLIDTGQVQIINHTFNHPDLTTVPVAQIREELERNDAWITKTFATSSHPYYRPPYGRHTPAVDDTAADLGFDHVVLWDGSLGDSHVITPRALMDQARRYLRPGVIMLGHANHPTVLGLFDQLAKLIHDRKLTPVTLDEMFGTHR